MQVLQKVMRIIVSLGFCEIVQISVEANISNVGSAGRFFRMVDFFDFFFFFFFFVFPDFFASFSDGGAGRFFKFSFVFE